MHVSPKIVATLVAATVVGAAGARPNMVNNAGFEGDLGFDFSNPYNWNGFFGGEAGTYLEAFNWTGATPNSGEKALVTTIRQGSAPTGWNGFTGHVQRIDGIIPGEQYEFAVYARTNPSINNGAEFRIEWRDDNVEIGRINVPIENDLTSDYVRYSMIDTAPEGATRALLVVAVQSFLNDGTPADTSVAWDDASFDVVSSCGPDFNGDGFLNGDDFDLFVAAFELGDLSADYVVDGFVNGDDFDAYVADFELGC